jgi:hypothetical protein
MQEEGFIAPQHDHTNIKYHAKRQRIHFLVRNNEKTPFTKLELLKGINP